MAPCQCSGETVGVVDDRRRKDQAGLEGKWRSGSCAAKAQRFRANAAGTFGGAGARRRRHHRLRSGRRELRHRVSGQEEKFLERPCRKLQAGPGEVRYVLRRAKLYEPFPRAAFSRRSAFRASSISSISSAGDRPSRETAWGPCAGWPARLAGLSAFALSTGAGLPGRLQASGTRQIVSIR